MRTEPGMKFWLGLVGLIIACGLGVMVIFLVLDAAWVRWGAVGAMIFVLVVIGGIVWFIDRRAVKAYEDLPG
jgi:membrane protein YdbS with pleckstrin-like domain